MAVRYVGDASEVYAVGPNGPSSAARWQILESSVTIKETELHSLQLRQRIIWSEVR